MSDEMDLATALAVVEALSVGVTMTEAERDRYREALEEFTKVAHFHRPDGSTDACVPCAARAALGLDGES